jgi:hypothetical protein
VRVARSANSVRRSDGTIEVVSTRRRNPNRPLPDLAHAHPAWGCPQLHQHLRRKGHRINHKQTERLYGRHGVALRRRRRRRGRSMSRWSAVFRFQKRR